MDDSRALLIAALMGLNRLQLRILKVQLRTRRNPQTGRSETHGHQLADLVPESPWCQGARPSTSLDALLEAIARVQIHVLSLIDAPSEIDGKCACLILQRLGGDVWTPAVLRLADRLGVELAPTPADEPEEVGIVGRPLPGRQRGLPL